MMYICRYLKVTDGYVANNAYVVKTPFTTHGSLYTKEHNIYCDNPEQISERLQKNVLALKRN